VATPNRPGNSDATSAAVTVDILTIFKDAVTRKVSDVLITSGAPIAFRINDEIQQVRMPPLTDDDAKKMVYEMLTPDQIMRFERDLELDFSITYEGKHRFRGNIFRQRCAVGASLRLIPSQIPAISELHLPPIVRELSMREQGLILVTGATGHGKSTTLSAMINEINTTLRKHVVTIEDPVEFIHKNKLSIIEQREVGEDTHSFAVALKHALRQNPDVLLVGEMRDPESIAAALTAAETGHLVISTLHTNDSVQAIDRIIDSFQPHQQGQIRSQLSLGLLAVIAQRLLPRADGRGRIVAVEILRNSAAVSNILREEKNHQLYSIMETHARDGMRTMDHAIKELYLKGLIAFEEAKARMRSPSNLQA